MPRRTGTGFSRLFVVDPDAALGLDVVERSEQRVNRRRLRVVARSGEADTTFSAELARVR